VIRRKPKASPAAAQIAKRQEIVRAIFRKLSADWGPQHWWPAETPFEVIVGAILTQNTTWTNVERAMGQLRAAGLLSVKGIRETPLTRLEELVRPSGYYRQKAQRLKTFVAFLDTRYDGSLQRMFAAPTETLRTELLTLNGVGPETADAILLYAGHHQVFVVDGYTRRILARHEAIPPDAKYAEVRSLVEDALRAEAPDRLSSNPRFSQSRPLAHSPTPMSSAQRTRLAEVYNEMHGLIVQLGKHYCHKQQPKCEICPLSAMLSDAMRQTLIKSGLKGNRELPKPGRVRRRFGNRQL
jgi:endonuclease-3 related protein